MTTLLTALIRDHYNEWLKAHNAPDCFASEEMLRNDSNNSPTRVPDEHNAGSCTPLGHLFTFHAE